MFDPTSFENMKVVFEGIFYDKDLEGEIAIIDRNDLINTAKLSRTYNLSFQLIRPYLQEPRVTSRVTLTSKLENLAAELIPILTIKDGAGCYIEIEFFYSYKEDDLRFKMADQFTKNLWEDAIIEHRMTVDPYSSLETKKHHIKITFNRIIKEDEIDLFDGLIEHIMTTLLQMEKTFK